MEEYLQVFTTLEKREDAGRIAKDIVEKRLAACAQIIGPIMSSYWWEGKVETAEEWLCLMKTKKNLYHRLEEALKAIHPYDVPEIVAVPIVAGHADYLNWLTQEATG